MTSKRLLDIFDDVVKQKLNSTPPEATKALNDLAFFNEVIFDRKNAPFHNNVCALLDKCAWDPKRKEQMKQIVLMPRGTAKSQIASVSFPLQQIARNRDVRILIASEAVTLTKEWLRQIENVMGENKLYREWYGEMVPSAKTQTWSDTEKIVVGRSPKATHLTLFAVGAHGALLGRRCDIAIIDDLLSPENTATEYQRESMEEWLLVKLLPCIEPNGSIIIVGCLPSSTKITMGDNTFKNIEDVSTGDVVYSLDETTNKLVKQKVIGVFDQGLQETYKITTRYGELEATPNHPFLVINSDGTLNWIRADSLSIGDIVVESRLISNGTRGPRISFSTAKTQFDLELSWMLGFMYGDGWLTSRNQVCFHAGKSKKHAEKMISIFNRIGLFPHKSSNAGAYVAYNVVAKKEFERLGFVGGAKTKKIPDWIFKLRCYARSAFIQGLCDSDGHKLKKSHGYILELANEPLIAQIKLLASISGWRVGKIRHRKRNIKLPSSQIYKESETWSIMLTPERKVYRVGNHIIPRHKIPIGCRIDVVEQITRCEKKRVWDLSVQGHPNFIANGFVVHNTKFHSLDLYYSLAQKAWPIFKIAVRDENGHSIWPERYSDEQLKSIEINMGSIYFNLQYMNDPSSMEGNLLKREWLHCYDEKDLPDDLEIFQAFDPCITATKGSDNCVLTTVGLHRQTNTVYILDIIVENIGLMSQLALLEAQTKVYRPLSLGIESNAAQALIPQIMETKILTPIKPIKTITNKASRFISLSALFQSRRVLIKGNRDINGILQPAASMRGFVNEWVSFPKGKDDILDSMDMAVGLAAVFGPAPSFGSAYNTQSIITPRSMEINMFHKNI